MKWVWNSSSHQLNVRAAVEGGGGLIAEVVCRVLGCTRVIGQVSTEASGSVQSDEIDGTTAAHSFTPHGHPTVRVTSFWRGTGDGR